MTNSTTAPTFDGTIDWNRYWRESDAVDQDYANGSATRVADAFLEFISDVSDLEAYADVGCGGGVLASAVAECHPETTVVGYDAAESVLEANRDRTRDGPANLSFERAVLPAFEPDRQFTVVSAFFTLCYVADAERALRNLYAAIEPGGYLVFTYHNRDAQSLFSCFADSPTEYLSASSALDPDRFPDRFELVIDGENLLSYDRIHDTLGTRPRSIWSVVDVDRYDAWRETPLVYVRK